MEINFISIALLVLSIIIWTVTIKLLNQYENDEDKNLRVHLIMLFITITLPLFYSNTTYLVYFIIFLIIYFIIMIALILGYKKSKLYENEFLKDYSEKCKLLSNKYPKRFMNESSRSYYFYNDKNFEKSEAFLQTKQFNKEINEILNDPLERLQAKKRSLEYKNKDEIYKIIRRKIGYEYELAIYMIFNTFEEGALNDDFINEVKKVYEIEEVSIAKKIINKWRDIDEYLIETNKIKNIAKKNEAKFIKYTWSKYSTPTQIELLASIKKYYNINELNAKEILDKWEENHLIEKVNPLNYSDIQRIFGDAKLSYWFIDGNNSFDGLTKFSIGPTLSINKLELRNTSLKFPYGQIVEFCGGDSNRITNMDLTFKQWKIIKRYKQDIYIIFESLKAKYGEHLNEFEHDIFVSQIVTEYQLPNSRIAYEFFIDIWLKNGLIKRFYYSGKYHKPLTTTYKISELLKAN